ncbi:hypothetical protein BU15DRAFT_82127 [Melanogaster broomeanus]|nr:hypothetical protein BU15DRAFT_82127 [Melanogaster broomeanus]
MAPSQLPAYTLSSLLHSRRSPASRSLRSCVAFIGFCSHSIGLSIVISGIIVHVRPNLSLTPLYTPESTSSPSLPFLSYPSVSLMAVIPLSLPAQPPRPIVPSVQITNTNPLSIPQIPPVPAMADVAPMQMPLRGTQNAPKFDGKTSTQLPWFLEDVDLLGMAAGLADDAKIRAAIRYADLEEAEVWETLTTVSGNDWDVFVAEVKRLYPGCEEADADVTSRVHHRILITNMALHPDDVYPMDEVLKAAEFLLSGPALRAPIPNAQPSFWPASHAHAHQHAPPTASQQPVPASVQPMAGGTVKQEVNLQNHEHTFNGECHFCTIWGHWVPDCKTAATYVGTGKLFWGSDRHLYLPQGRKIPCYSHCKGMQQSIDYWYETNMTTTTVTTPVTATTSMTSSFIRDLPPHMTAGILSITGPEIEVELEIESSAYMGTSSDYTWQRGPDVDDPAFQPYVAATWANFQNDMASDRSGNRGKCIRFDGTTRQPKEILSPEVQAAAGQGVPHPAAPPASGATSGPTSHPDTSASMPPPVSGLQSSTPRSANPSSFPNTPTQYRYLFPLEDKTAPKRVLERVLESTVPILVKDLFAVSPDFQKQFRDMTMTKRVATGVVQVNELSRRDPDAVGLSRSDTLRQTISCILDAGSEIITMPKWVWQSLGLPVHSDHIMTMESANTQKDATIGMLENLQLNFGSGDVFVQVQVLGRANFELLLGRPFHCLMSATTDDFPDGSQNVTLRDPNTGKEYKLPTHAWLEGCPSCKRGIHCGNHQSIIKMGF